LPPAPSTLKLQSEHDRHALPGIKAFHHGGEKVEHPVVFVAGIFETLLVHHWRRAPTQRGTTPRTGRTRRGFIIPAGVFSITFRWLPYSC